MVGTLHFLQSCVAKAKPISFPNAVSVQILEGGRKGLIVVGLARIGKGMVDNSVLESSGLGFKNIKERTGLLNGEVILESDDRGTTVEVNIPIE